LQCGQKEFGHPQLPSVLWLPPKPKYIIHNSTSKFEKILENSAKIYGGGQKVAFSWHFWYLTLNAA
jgi:hypothetical protein